MALTPRLLAVSVLTTAMLAPTSTAASPQIDVDVERDGPIYHVEANVRAAATAARVWEVLTDFDKLADFVPDLRESRVISPPGEPLRVLQHGVLRTFFLSRDIHVTVAIELQQPLRIDFHAISGNLRMLRGYWQLTNVDRGCLVRYVADSEPEFWMPPLVGTALLRRQIRRQFDGVLAEIEHRAESARSHSSAREP